MVNVYHHLGCKVTKHHKCASCYMLSHTYSRLSREGQQIYHPAKTNQQPYVQPGFAD